MGLGRAAFLGRAIFVACVFAAGMAAEHALEHGHTGEPTDKEIRPGRIGFTNPLYDCEVGFYPPGRELRPFKPELEELVGRLIARGDAAEVALYFRDLDNGPWVGLDEEKPFTPGSLLKVPLLMACLIQESHDPGFLRREVRYDGLPDKGGVNAYAA